MVAENTRRVWDAAAQALGPTPKRDPNGLVVPNDEPEDPTVPHHRAKIYVVWTGRAVGLFYNWGLTNAMVCGFSGSAYRRFVGLENARAAWEQGPIVRGGPGRGQWEPPLPRVAMPAPEPAPNPLPVADVELPAGAHDDHCIIAPPS